MVTDLTGTLMLLNLPYLFHLLIFVMSLFTFYLHFSLTNFSPLHLFISSHLPLLSSLILHYGIHTHAHIIRLSHSLSHPSLSHTQAWRCQTLLCWTRLLQEQRPWACASPLRYASYTVFQPHFLSPLCFFSISSLPWFPPIFFRHLTRPTSSLFLVFLLYT
jgi:hypothetical protein